MTIDYLVNADELQIKIAQGAKPGEGGQLPGHKVDERIAKLRYATPGVELISPPPHHDIYSIEDLKQLIHDLRCANPAARVSVKLASEAGVGTVAAGVVKALADHVVIAGHDGGTGAAPQSSLHNAGVPWELGLAETQQTLVRNGLRSRVVLQADGGMKTGRDVVVAALLGAEEVGFSTAPLIALGCIMMRVCHLNTCPVGIATQDPELRRRYAGRPEQVVRFAVLVAEEARRIMASLGIRRFDDLIGRADLLRVRPGESWKAEALDLTPLLEAGAERMTRRTPRQREALLDDELIAGARPALAHGRRVELQRPVTNADRAVGALLSGAVTRRRGARGLPESTIRVTLTGSAGQSAGAWLAPGIDFTVQGDVNDYAGKGLSGGLLTVRPDARSPLRAEDNVIAGNTTLYGATAGRAFFRGLAGERFAVRNSGAAAVVEGVGDHGCEYMTGGRVVVLGPTGRNFAAGMSGGIAYVLDADGGFAGRCNHELVDLEPVEDDGELRALVEEHARRTGSEVAERLLAGWDPGRFVHGDAARLPGGDEGVGRGGGGGLMADPRGFLEITRVADPERDPAERIHDHREIFGTLPAGEVSRQGARCMDCGTPFCHVACPLGNLIPEWNDLVRRDDWREAIDRLHATNNFPEFTGLICPAPCESACVLAINDDPVMIKQVEWAIVERAFEEGWIEPRAPSHRTGRSVAVIGSGPAGMAAAEELNAAGHHVVVYERDEGPGGLIRLGVPDFKFEKWMIDRRADLMARAGIEFRYGVEAGVDVRPSSCAREHDAVVLAVGARVERELDVPGRELDGVHRAMEYLVQRNRAVAGREAEEPITAAGRHVVVIGGGDTAADCVASAHREQAASVTQVDIYPSAVRRARVGVRRLARAPQAQAVDLRARRGRRAASRSSPARASPARTGASSPSARRSSACRRTRRRPARRSSCEPTWC